MKSMKTIIVGVAAGFIATCGTAYAAPNFIPEPDSLGLLALGVAAVVLYTRRGRK